jgi:hypothetical protein
VLTIVDSDAAGKVQFGVSDFSVSQTGPYATITVERSGGKAGGVTVEYATEDDTAQAGKDYLAVSGTLTFGDGEASQSFTVPVLDDAFAEPSRTVRLLLRDPTGGLLLDGRSTATLWIVSNR